MTSEIRANTIKNRVGLGTVSFTNTGPVISGVTTISNDLHIESALPRIYLTDTNHNSDWYIGNSDGTIIFYDTTLTNTRFEIYQGNSPTTKPFIRTPYTTDCRFDGFVRIGAVGNSPNHSLTVGGNSNFSGISTFVDLDVDGHTNLDNVSVAGVSTFTGAVTAHDYRSGGGVGNTLYLTSADDWRFRTTGGSERLRIDATGDVSIGSATNAGSNRLNVVDSFTDAFVNPTDSILRITNENTSANTNQASISLTTQTTGSAADSAIVSQAEDASGNSNLQFWTDTANGMSEKLRITSEGKMGLGVTSPIADFEIYKGSGISSCVVRGPKALLAIMGDIDNNGADESDASLMFTSDSHTNLTSPLSSHGFEIALINDEPGAGLRFHSGTANAERLRIDSNGKIGIGTNNPDELLHIFSGASSSKIVLEADNNSANNGIYWVDEGNNTTSEFYYDHGGNKQHLRVNGNGLEIYSKQTNSVIAKIGHGTGYNDLIIPNGKLGVNDDSPASNTNLSVKTDGLADNTYAFATEYRSGNNASGYTASGIAISSKANNSNGEDHTAFIKFDNRTAAQNGAHGVAAFITLTAPDTQGTYGTGEFNFYCRNASAYSFPNDPAVPSNFWMSSLLKIKSNKEIYGYGNLRIDTGTSADGILGRAYGTAYFGLKQADQTSSEYMMISNNTHTYISCTSGNSIYIRPSANSSAHETIFAHDNTTFKTNVVMESHALRRNQHQWGHMEGGHNNIGSSNVKSCPIYTIGSAYNPNENDLNNMYGIGYCHRDASFINSNIGSGWGLYVASDGDARMFLNGGDGVVYAKGYGRYEHDTGHLIGSYNNVGANSANTNPIYTIGSSYNPSSSSLSNMYGIGYSHGNNASFLNFSGLTGWGLYVAADGDARMFLDATTGKIAANGTITGGSDVRLKTNIKVIDNPIEKINKIRGVTFDWVDNITSEYDFHPDSMHETGVIAQEIQEVIPDAVATAPFNGNYTRKSGTDNNYLTVQHEKIIPLCIEAIKELSAKVEVLEQENTTLKARVNTLEG